MVAAKGLQVEAQPRRYKVLLPLTVSTADGSWTQGQEFDHVFTADEEWENVDSGLLGIIPDWYEVIGDSSIEVNLVEAPATFSQKDQMRLALPGETFQASIPLAREEQLRFHIRRVAPPAPEKPAAKPAAKPKSTKE